MRIFGYGIEIRRLTIDDIELVREKRNSKEIQQYMEFRSHISKSDQLKWFKSINNIHHNYFVIVSQNKKVGLIYGAKIDWDKRETGNGGIFIWDRSVMNTTVPLAASLLITDTSILLGLKRTFIKVLKTNKVAISFNKGLGYQLLPNQEHVMNQRYCLETEIYQNKSKLLKKKLFAENKSTEKKIEFDLNDEINRFYDNRIKQEPQEGEDQFAIYSYS